MSTSYNGWTASRDPDAIGIVSFAVAGRSFPAGVKKGDVKTVFTYLAAQIHLRVESLTHGYDADDWGYSYRANVNNPSQLSCHSSGTAIDINATEHPNGSRNTFSPTQVRELREILNECGGVIKWGGDFSTTKDEMHFEIKGNAAAVKAVGARLRSQSWWWKRDLYLTGSDKSKWLRGDDVKHLQARLGIPVDGVFGPATRDAVKRLEARLKLTQTGKVTRGRAFYVG